MSTDDLLRKFSDIEDLPVSEELLGAYLEGTLSGAEMREIRNIIDTEPLFAELYCGLSGADDILPGRDFPGAFHETDYMDMGAMALPEIPECPVGDMDVCKPFISSEYIPDDWMIPDEGHGDMPESPYLHDDFTSEI